jgi:hypothetical protein
MTDRTYAGVVPALLFCAVMGFAVGFAVEKVLEPQDRVSPNNVSFIVNSVLTMPKNRSLLEAREYYESGMRLAEDRGIGVLYRQEVGPLLATRFINEMNTQFERITSGMERQGWCKDPAGKIFAGVVMDENVNAYIIESGETYGGVDERIMKSFQKRSADLKRSCDDTPVQIKK